MLTEPGTADLTADVDFLNLKRSCSEHTICYGPVEQGDFLRAMGIEVRLQKLTQSTTATEEAKAQVRSHKTVFLQLTAPLSQTPLQCIADSE